MEAMERDGVQPGRGLYSLLDKELIRRTNPDQKGQGVSARYALADPDDEEQEEDPEE